MTPSSPNTTSPTTTTPPPENLSCIPCGKQCLDKIRSARRPWRLLYLNQLSCPHSFSDIVTRIKTNLSYFYMNFIIFSLLALSVSLYQHPITVLDCLLLTRDEPFVFCGRVIDGRVTFVVLSVLTLLFFFLTGPITGYISFTVGLVITVVYVVVFSVFRRVDDLYLDEEEAAAGGLLADWTGVEV